MASKLVAHGAGVKPGRFVRRITSRTQTQAQAHAHGEPPMAWVGGAISNRIEMPGNSTRGAAGSDSSAAPGAPILKRFARRFKIPSRARAHRKGSALLAYTEISQMATGGCWSQASLSNR